MVQVDSEGAIKVGAKSPEATCDIGGAYALRQAFLRRSLAFDLGHLASFSVMETYVSMLFEHLQRPVPKGYSSVTLGQVLAADKELFVRAAHELDGKLQSPAGASRPLDAAITTLSASQGSSNFCSQCRCRRRRLIRSSVLMQRPRVPLIRVRAISLARERKARVRGARVRGKEIR